MKKTNLPSEHAVSIRRKLLWSGQVDHLLSLSPLEKTLLTVLGDIRRQKEDREVAAASVSASNPASPPVKELSQGHCKVCVDSPVGIYNMGNTCFVSCVLQCLLRVPALQHYFLTNVSHDFRGCEEIRRLKRQLDGKNNYDVETKTKKRGRGPTDGREGNYEDDSNDLDDRCLVCEVRRRFGGSRGNL